MKALSETIVRLDLETNFFLKAFVLLLEQSSRKQKTSFLGKTWDYQRSTCSDRVDSFLSASRMSTNFLKETIKIETPVKKNPPKNPNQEYLTVWQLLSLN